MPEPPIDLAKTHRWFAVELNNLAWDLVEKRARSDAETDRMLHAAHTSCWHWLQVGDPEHHQRALCLLATAYARAGDPLSSVRYASQCICLSDENPSQQTPFDRATAHGCAALVYSLAGNAEKASHHHDLATKAAAELDDDDRAVFEQLYGSVRS